MTFQAKKSLGQHFLNSRHVLEQIITAADLKKGETVLEIGPGTGILTEALLAAGANVVAVEKDARASALLNAKFKDEITRSQLTLVMGDILDPAIFQSSNLPFFAPRELVATKGRQSSIFPTSLHALRFASGTELRRAGNLKSFALVANIPYYITGAILQKFLEESPRPNRMVLLVQKEVADRIVAIDGKESILSISVKAFGIPKIVARVPRGAFTPPPTVDSAILSITSISDDHFTKREVDVKKFFELVRAGFALG